MTALGYDEREVRDGFASYVSAQNPLMLPIVLDISEPLGESEFQERLESQGVAAGPLHAALEQL